MIGRVIAKDSPADPTDAINVVAIEINCGGRRVDVGGVVVGDQDLGLEGSSLRRRRIRDVGIAVRKDSRQGPVRNEDDLRVCRDSAGRIHREGGGGVRRDRVGMTFFRVRRGGGSDQQVAVIRLRSLRVNELICGPAGRAGHRQGAAGNRCDGPDKRLRPGEGNRDECIRVAQARRWW